MAAPPLDCCPEPDLEIVREITREYHDAEALERCKRCGTHWFWRFHERVDFSGDGDDFTDAWVRLSEDLASGLREAAGRPDLAVLRGRPAIIRDRDGVRRVASLPWY